MQIATEVNNYLNNINHYVKEIEKAVEKQLVLDFETDERLSDPNSKRFIALNVMLSNCTWIKSNLKGIHANMLSAIKEDKVKV